MLTCEAMKGLKVSPYILATLLIALLVTSMQTTKSSMGRGVHAQESAGTDYFYLPVGSPNVSNVSERDYIETINEFQNRFQEKVTAKTGKPFVIPNEWSSPYFAAYAIKKDDFMQVSLWGGTVRAQGMKKVMMAAILCHELGHILAGVPQQTIPGSEWASTEGQSDFYAGSQCLPEYLRDHPELVSLTDIAPQILQMCGDNVDCERTAQTGWDLVNFFQKYSYHEFIPVSLDVHEKPAKELVLNTYPSDQCRLDTFLAGAQCQLGSECRAPTCWLPAQ